MMTINSKSSAELRFIRYSRKSSEAKERQALSISQQNKECDIYADRELLHVVTKFDEEKSAFKPGRRDKFTKMVEMIKAGKADAILTWKPDRICRNPLEGGVILQLLQDGLLKEIRSPLGDVYTPDSDHLILQIHFGMANQYSRNLSQNVRRGLYRKIMDRKEYPRPARIGFEGFGERGQRNIRPNAIEAPFIKKAFELAATGVYSLDHICNILYNEGFRTRSGAKVGKSHLQQILTCPTYYGYFLWNGELCEGNYDPIVSKGLFDLVQEKLNDRSKPKNIKWQREFVRLIRCGNCGCAITTTIKRKYVKKDNIFAHYTYHHCTHRKGNCKEKPLTDSELKRILIDEISNISIDLDVWQLGMDLVKAKYKQELEKNKHHFQYLHIQQTTVRDQINRLIEMRSNNELTKEEFIEQKNRLLDKLAALGNKTQDNEHSLKTWLELMEDFFNTAFQIRDVLESGNAEQKQIVLSKVGENFLLQGKKLIISFKKPYDVLLKPEVRTDVLRDMDSNHGKRIQSPLSYR